VKEYSDSFKTLEADFFNYETGPEPKVIVYSSGISPRLAYTCDFIFRQGLRINYKITDNVQEFTASSLAKINYSERTFDHAINISPDGLLFETGIKKFQPKGERKNSLVYFFVNGKTGFHFDIFSAVFYFISRYEEYLPFVKDDHGRFEIRNSLLYIVSHFRAPLLDQWIAEFKAELLQQQPELLFPKRSFRYLSTIDVDNVYAYKTKPFGRMAGANLKDFLSMNFANISHRLQTRYMNKPDPFDAYKLQIGQAEKTKVPLVYFFLCRNNTAYDRTINPLHPMLTQLLNSIRDRGVTVGLHPSYFSSEDIGLLEHEIGILKGHLKENVEYSRQHFLKMNIKTTPAQLAALGIKYDFTMGYSSEAGYRAGTSLPFYYYDFEKEQPLSILAVPFVVMDGSYYQYKKMTAEAAEADMMELAEEVKTVNGLFVTVFHDRTFWERQFPGWKQMYLRLQEKLGGQLAPEF
jgi:hypothetical protein